MAVFGKRGASKPVARPAAVQRERPVTAKAADDHSPPPRFRSGAGLSWSKPLTIKNINITLVPDDPGVFALMGGPEEADIVYLGGTKDLRSEFQIELASQAALVHPHAQYFSFAIAPTPNEQAEKEIAIFRRRFGRIPRLNSGF
ncbi:hypothetical protein [Hyphobacterium sp.]|uniref:hypothetical protein n=1 Tax=Hyphobacterium sp. TaxID=2004662 RepID=UPI003B52494D